MPNSANKIVQLARSQDRLTTLDYAREVFGHQPRGKRCDLSGTSRRRFGIDDHLTRNAVPQER